MDDGKQQGGSTRRGGLGASLKVALAAPAALAALPLRAVAADSGDKGHGNDHLVHEFAHEEHHDAQREQQIARLEARIEALRAQGLAGQRVRLLKVSDVSSSDFDKGNAASSQDSLTTGAVRVARASGSNAGVVEVALAGAAANVTYNVVFVRFWDHGREGIGNVKTDGNGNFGGLARSNSDNTGDPGHLGGNNRAGAFVLTRDGKDQFISGFVTQ
jgi:TolA-binding protein